MTSVSVFGADVNAMLATALAQAVGQQKQHFTSALATALGANAIVELRAGGVVVYRATIAGNLTANSSGIVLPVQFTEPASLNVANALTVSDAVFVIRNASNAAVYISVPIKAGLAVANFLTASKALDGTRLARTSGGVLLKAPSTLDVVVGAPAAVGGAFASKQAIVDSMSTANDSGWWIEAAPNTQDTNGPGGVQAAFVGIGLRRSDGRSHWPGEYLSDSAPRGVALSDSTNVFLLCWYVVGRAAQITAPPNNNRAQMRNLRVYGQRWDFSWETIGLSADPMPGSSWHANFRSPGNETLENTVGGTGFYDVRSEAGNDGGSSLGGIGFGNDGSAIPRRYKWANHGYGASATKTRKQWVDTYRAMVYAIEGRVIKHDPNGPDNRNSSGLLVWPGSDWYRDSPRGAYINEHCHGRLQKLTGDWKTFNYGEFNPNDILNYPPPGYS